VLVVGAGIIGLASAYRLARAGHRVTLVDPAPATGATWAAAGMIAPSAEIAPGEEDNYALQCRAPGAWRDLGAELAGLTGVGVTLHETGTLVVGWDASDRRLVDQYVDVARAFGATVRAVNRESHPEVFAALSDRITTGVVMDGDAWLDPDEAVTALLRALDALGVEVVQERVTCLSTAPDGVTARTETRTLHADLGLLTTGAAPLPEGVASPPHDVRPVRGITVRVAGPDRSDQPTVRAFVRGRAFYMVSRPGGHCVLGASSEERRDASIEVGELSRLLRDGLEVVPSLETAAIVETRVGLRPASEDGRPFLTGLDLAGWTWSSGHYRHGVTLAPLAALDALAHVEERS
jgi:glycine oxidase